MPRTPCAVALCWALLIASAGRAAAQTTVGVPCMPDCRSGYICLQGQCVERCNPVCPQGQRCTEDAACVAETATVAPPLVSTITNGATPAGSGGLDPVIFGIGMGAGLGESYAGMLDLELDIGGGENYFALLVSGGYGVNAEGSSVVEVSGTLGWRGFLGGDGSASGGRIGVLVGTQLGYEIEWDSWGEYDYVTAALRAAVGWYWFATGGFSYGAEAGFRLGYAVHTDTKVDGTEYNVGGGSGPEDYSHLYGAFDMRGRVTF